MGGPGRIKRTLVDRYFSQSGVTLWVVCGCVKSCVIPSTRPVREEKEGRVPT